MSGAGEAPSLPAPKRRPPEPCSTPTDGSSEEERHRLLGVPPPEHSSENLAWLQAGKNLLDFGGKVVEAAGETGEAAMEAADMQTEASAGAGASSAVQADAAADGASPGAPPPQPSRSTLPLTARLGAPLLPTPTRHPPVQPGDTSPSAARAAATTATSRCCSATASSAAWRSTPSAAARRSPLCPLANGFATLAS